MTRRARASLTASPVLVGAVTVLVTIVAVFISYNANQGLPFVPTYDLKAELPNGAKLVPGNEVRAGGFRVGVVEDITSERKTVDGEETSIAVLDLKLDKTVEPLPVDSALAVRPRSALGLKYVELVPGTAERTFRAGATMPLRNTRGTPQELEDVLSTFGADTRDSARASLEGFGSALAGRGPSINVAIEEFAPFLRHLRPVMENLSDPRTELAGFFRGLGAAAAEAAPVAEVQADLFTNMADTFAAIGRNPRALQETIEESPPTLEASIRSFAVQTPFLANFADLSRRLRPGAVELRRSLPPINRALRVGTPVMARVPELGEDLEQLMRALNRLGRNPNTLLALRDLRRGLTVTRPLIRFVAPYQTVCNQFVYFWNPLGTHQSRPTEGGTVERILAKLVDGQYPNSLGHTDSQRPVDVPANEDPQDEPPQQALHVQYGGPAVDSAGRADCQVGQTGYPFRLVRDGRYPPSNDPEQGGGNHVVVEPDTPGLAGGTFKSRELGIRGTGDLP